MYVPESFLSPQVSLAPMIYTKGMKERSRKLNTGQTGLMSLKMHGHYDKQLQPSFLTQQIGSTVRGEHFHQIHLTLVDVVVSQLYRTTISKDFSSL
jgi:hypothetical protein